MENNVSRKLQSLSDGYKLTHEKQWEPERRLDQLEQLVGEISERIA